LPADQLLETPLGQEIHEFTRRVLGDEQAAREAATAALAGGHVGRLEVIARAVDACRRHAGRPPGADSPPHRNGTVPASLAQAVALELHAANAALPARQRQALAMREMLRLSYPQIGALMSLEQPAVASLLARARLVLRAQLRDSAVSDPEPRCVEREHALRVLARRQDSEPLREADMNWLHDHMGDCVGCEKAHAAMLEASVRYRAWGRP
jgi:hypothetical protein